MYRVIKLFTDKQDMGYEYKVGDEFPRKGKQVSNERLAELSGSNNLQGVPLIRKEEPKKGTFNKREDEL